MFGVLLVIEHSLRKSSRLLYAHSPYVHLTPFMWWALSRAPKKCGKAREQGLAHLVIRHCLWLVLPHINTLASFRHTASFCSIQMQTHCTLRRSTSVKQVGLYTVIYFLPSYATMLNISGISGQYIVYMYIWWQQEHFAVGMQPVTQGDNLYFLMSLQNLVRLWVAWLTSCHWRNFTIDWWWLSAIWSLSQWEVEYKQARQCIQRLRL